MRIEIDYEKVERVLWDHPAISRVAYSIPNHIPDEQIAKFIFMKEKKGGEKNGRGKSTRTR